MNVGNNGTGFCSVTPDHGSVAAWNITASGNNDVCIWNIVTSVENSSEDVYFIMSQVQRSARGKLVGTQSKNMTNPVEVHPPGRNCLFIVFRVKNSRDCILFIPLDNVPLDIDRDPDCGL